VTEKELLSQLCSELLTIRKILEDGSWKEAWLSAEEVAVRLSVSRDFVYEHRDELGGYPISGGSRPRLRFDPRTVDAFVRWGSTRPPEQPALRKSGPSVELLPVKDD
jgi:hypothetical protein